MLAFFLVCFKAGITIDGHGFVIAFARFAVVIPGSCNSTYVVGISNQIEYADRGGRRFVAFTLVIVAMHVCDSESTDIFRRTFGFLSDPALRRVWQNGWQFLIINRVRHENGFVLRTCSDNPEGDE